MAPGRHRERRTPRTSPRVAVEHSLRARVTRPSRPSVPSTPRLVAVWTPDIPGGMNRSVTNLETMETRYNQGRAHA